MTDKYLPRDGARVIDAQHTGDYEQLNCNVLIVGNCFLAGAISLFAKAGCTRARTIEEADLVVFLGGEDVDPALYGEIPLRCTYFNRDRDDREKAVFDKCIELSKPMFGICRGMQFLHVMNGGKLYQDVQQHAIGGTHDITDIQTGEVIAASSMHHQMCIEDDMTFPLAYATEPGRGQMYLRYAVSTTSPNHKDLEAAAYPAINAIAVQGHPEVSGTPRYSQWTISIIKEFMEELLGVPELRPVVNPKIIAE